MGLFSSLFGRRSIEDDFVAWGSGLADETERAYREQVSPSPASALGLLRARLMASAFTFCAFSSVVANKEQEREFLILGCQIAAYSLLKPGASTTISQSTVSEVSMPFIQQVARLIIAEISSTDSETTSHAFLELQSLYEKCLKESVGDRRQPDRLPVDYAVISRQVIAHSLSRACKKLAELKGY